MPRRSPWALPAWLSLGAVLYITLLPFRFEELSLAEAWATYTSMQFGELRPSARQQWVANAFMFLPLGFFWMAWLSQGVRSIAGRFLVGVFVALLCLSVTATVEFIQAWIPRRVPSLIDLSGNFTGGVAGVLLWTLARPRLTDWRAGLRTHGLESALTFYVVVYVIAALLPFDFLLSWSEWQAKLASSHLGWWAAESGCSGGLRCTALRVIELVATIPIGAWLALRLRGLLARPWLAGAVAGVGFGLAMEFGQLLTVSGIAEGRSVVTRGLGVMLGIHGFLHRERLLRPEWLGRHGRLLVWWLAAPYVLVLFLLNVGVRNLHLDIGRAAQTLSELHWLPFYYHYMVSESVAIASVLLHLAMYAPVGAAVWLWSIAPDARRRDRRTDAILWAAGLAMVMETGKLFVIGRHPDYTDVLIAAVAALVTFVLLSWAWRQWLGLEPSPPVRPRPATQPAAAGGGATASSNDDSLGPPPVMRMIGALLGAVTLVVAVTWPVASLWLVLGLVAYAAWLWRRHEAWLLAIPAMIPVLNLSHYSGRFFFDELDLLVLTTLAVAAWRWRPGRGLVTLPRPALWALLLFVGSATLALVTALWPWQAIDVNAWSHYASQYNALRVAKGLVWALLLFLLLRQSDLSLQQQLERWFVPGMVLGLLFGVLAVVRERLVYPGLLDFDSRYRISGLFTDMHAGGPSIETWLVMTTPFVLLWAWQRGFRWGWLPVLGLFALAIHAIAVTYSRGGYLGIAVTLLVLVIGMLAARRRIVPAAARLRLAALIVLPLLVTGAVVSQFAGSFAEQRMERIAGDMEQRLAHWSIARRMAATGGGTNWFGRGLGSFPRHYHAGNPFGRIPGNYAVGDEAGDRYLRIGTGDSLFINQRVTLPREDGYRFEARFRVDAPSRLSVYVCEKFIRYSFNCRVGRLVAPAEALGQWTTVDWEFDLGDFDDRVRPLRRGMTLAMSYGGGDGVIAIDRVRLIGPDGTEYLANDDFQRGLRHWYPTTDHLWPWRIENQWLEIWFDQGWLGLLAFVALTLIAAVVMVRRILRGSLLDLFLLAAIAGALAVGLFGTIFWSPRLMLLFFLLLLFGLVSKDNSTSVPVGTEPEPISRR